MSNSITGTQALELGTNILALVALTNPKTAASMQTVTTGMTLVRDVIMPIVSAARASGELTAEQEAAMRAGAEQFWADVDSGAAFSGPEWTSPAS